MQNTANISSEEELLQLRNEGKITEAEYEQLRAAMEMTKKGEAEKGAPEAEGVKWKRKMGKRAFILMLAGFIVPAIGWGITVIIGGVENEPAFAPLERTRTQADSGNTSSLRGDEQSGDRLRGVRERREEGVRQLKQAKQAKQATESKRRWLLALVAVWGFLCVGPEICAFVLGVIAWPDVFGKATVVCLSSIVVLVIVFALLFTA
ncbi:MAG TPA: hypothetical protein VMX13_12450 [Sedimentisphaerales bacterium]|nr:hypothetical protein [Sedimentisphaerales bacterium]